MTESTSSYDRARAEIKRQRAANAAGRADGIREVPAGDETRDAGDERALYHCRLKAQAEYWEVRKRRLLETAEADEALLAEALDDEDQSFRRERGCNLERRRDPRGRRRRVQDRG